MKRNILCTLLGAITLMTVSMQNGSALTRGLFLGNQYTAPGPYYEGLARNSNMTCLILFASQINTNGDIVYNNSTLCSNGSYVGNSVWDSQLNGCRGGSVNRIELCFGGWATSSFANIKNLINSQGTGSGSILYRNFQALKNKVNIDAIQFDDETTYDVNSMVSFAKMLTDSLGWHVSLCPYTNQSFWANVKVQLPNGRVTGVWLQCYDGGAGNSPTQWRSALGNTSVLFPGDWTNDGQTTVTNYAKGWRNSGLNGAFIYANGAQPDPQWGQWLINAGF